MSDHEYTPKSKVGKWFNDRLPLLTLANHLTDYPTPKNLNYWWTFGGILTFCLVTQIITGIILAMHYTPHVDHAFNSVEHIMRNVNHGWLIRYIHANGASMFFLAKLKQDLHHLWAVRNQNVYTVRIHQIYEYIWDKLEVRYADYMTDSFHILDVINALRIEPYLTSDSQRVILEGIVKSTELYAISYCSDGGTIN